MNSKLNALSRSTFGALLKLSEKTVSAYSAASFELSGVGPRALLRFLAGQHEEHIESLRRHCEQYDVAPSSRESADATSESAWREICGALASPKRDVVLITCQLVERLCVRAFRHAIDAFAMHGPTLQLIQRQIRELEATQEFITAICSECTSDLACEPRDIRADGTRALSAEAGAASDDPARSHRLPALKNLAKLAP